MSGNETHAQTHSDVCVSFSFIKILTLSIVGDFFPARKLQYWKTHQLVPYSLHKLDQLHTKQAVLFCVLSRLSSRSCWTVDQRRSVKATQGYPDCIEIPGWDCRTICLWALGSFWVGTKPGLLLLVCPAGPGRQRHRCFWTRWPPPQNWTKHLQEMTDTLSFEFGKRLHPPSVRWAQMFLRRTCKHVEATTWVI